MVTSLESTRQSRWAPAVDLAVVGLLAALILATYANIFDVGLILDSRLIVVNATQVHALSLENLRLILTRSFWWPTIKGYTYRPLTTFSFLLNYAVLGNGEQAAGYHWLDLGLHWGNAVLVYLLMLRLSGARLAAAGAAALFAVHPIATEAVTNIVGRADLLATSAVLGALLLHMRVPTARRKWPWRVGVVLIASAGVLCKESAVTVVGVIGLYDVLFRLEPWDARSPRHLGARVTRLAVEGWIPLLLPLALLWAMRRWVADVEAPPLHIGDNVLVIADLFTARLTAIRVVGAQLWQLLWPARLCWDYSVNETPLFGWDLRQWADQQALLAVGVLVGIAILAARLWRRAPGVVFCIGFFFVTVLPTSNLLVLTYSVRGDRFLYLPSVGAAGGAALGLAAAATGIARRWGRRSGRQPSWPPWVALGLMSLAVVALGARAHRRNRDWQSELTLSTQDVQSCPNSFRIHEGLARVLFWSDRRGNLDRVIAEAETAQAILDQVASPAGTTPGSVLEDLGLYYTTKATMLADEERRWDEKAVAALERAAAAEQALDAVHRQNMARLGRAANEVPELGDGMIYVMLGQAYARLNQPGKAVAALTHARRLMPADANVYAALGSAYGALGDDRNEILSLLQTSLCDQSRQDVWPRLYALYQRVDPGGCAFVQTGGQYRFNHDCPIVRRDICAAIEQQAQAFAQAGQVEALTTLRRQAAELHGCSPAGSVPRGSE